MFKYLKSAIKSLKKIIVLCEFCFIYYTIYLKIHVKRTNFLNCTDIKDDPQQSYNQFYCSLRIICKYFIVYQPNRHIKYILGYFIGINIKNCYYTQKMDDIQVNKS